MAHSSQHEPSNMTKEPVATSTNGTAPGAHFTSPASKTAQGWFNAFNAALQARDIPKAASLFGEESYWRDLVSFSWNLVTVEGPAGVTDLLENTLDRVDPSGWEITQEAEEADGVNTSWFKFNTAVGNGWGILRLKNGKAWTLITAIQELSDHPEPSGVRRPKGAEHGISSNRLTWKEKLEAEDKALGDTAHPYVLVIGGGQGGIALGARLRQMGVPSLVVDRQGRPGDQWRGRYKSLCLHDPVWYDHMPYLKFPDNWPVFTPKDKVADWLEFYTKVMEVPYWSSTTVQSAKFDKANDEWVVELTRDGKPMTLKPKQLVFATGMVRTVVECGERGVHLADMR